MSSIQLLAGNFKIFPPDAVQLDLDKEESIPFNFKILDVKDISRRGSGHSFEFNLPGSPTNNKFFGGLYDINADFSQFNPNIKTQCRYLLDAEQIINGYLQLKSIFRDSLGNIRYKVTLYDLTGDFYQTIRQRFLKDLDLSALNHVLNIDNVKNSWDNDWNLNHLGVAGASTGDNGGYFYPLLKEDNPVMPIPIEHWQPALFYKRLLNEVIRQAHPSYPAQEYTWSGDLYNDADFAREGLPYVGDRPKISELAAEQKACFVGRDADYNIITSANNLGYLAPINVNLNLNDEVNPPFNDTYNLYSVDTFTAPVDGLYKFDINIGIDIEVDYAVLTVPGFDNTNREIVHEAFILLDVQDSGGNTVNPFYLQTFGVNQPYQIPFEPGNNPVSTGGGAGQFSNILTNMVTGNHTEALSLNLPNCTSQIPGIEEAGSIYMQAGWTVSLKLRIKSAAMVLQGTNDIDDLGISVIQSRYRIKQGSSFRSQKFQHGYANGLLLNAADFVDPNLKQVDLFNDLVARKNCIIYVNPDNENDIVIDYRDDFYSRGATMDLTQQIDNGTQDEIRPIGELQQQEIVITYKQGDDTYNKEYSARAAGDAYGLQRVIFGNEFVKGIKKIESPFMPTPFIRQPLGFNTAQPVVYSVIVPAIKSREAKTKPRVLYMRKGLFTDDVSINQDGSTVQISISYKDGNGVVQEDLITGYPYSGHYDHPINPTLDINPGVLPFVLAEMPDIGGFKWEPTSNTEYARRWANTIKQIAEGRLRISKARLKPNQMHFIRNNPNTKIFIENTYYYINKILFEGNQNLTKLATLELITVEDLLNPPIDIDNYGGTFSDQGLEKDPPGLNTTSVFGSRPDVDNGNTVGKDNDNISIKGQGNYVGSNTENTEIKGGGNYVNSGTKNATVNNGDNNYIAADNVTVNNADGYKIFVDGVTVDGNTMIYQGTAELLFNKVEGGKNALRSTSAFSEVNKLEGTKDGLRDPFSRSNIGKIDSRTGNTKIIE